jgi:methylated-DNA-[protein]-cysteine S-methyltransferase
MSNPTLAQAAHNLDSLTLSDLPILGTISIHANGNGICRVDFRTDELPAAPIPISRSSLLLDAAAQIQEYLDGGLTKFDLPIDWEVVHGFYRDALQLCHAIPYGRTRTYGDIAVELGKPFATARAVGTAMARNPIPVIIPCHRVVGKDGKLRGYSGPRGIETKAALLHLEGARMLP